MAQAMYAIRVIRAIRGSSPARTLCAFAPLREDLFPFLNSYLFAQRCPFPLPVLE
jgi:hypothetical protein